MDYFDHKPGQKSTKLVHRWLRKGLSDGTFEGNIRKPNFKGGSLLISTEQTLTPPSQTRRRRHVRGDTAKEPDGKAAEARAQGAGLQGLLRLLSRYTDRSAEAVSQITVNVSQSSPTYSSRVD